VLLERLFNANLFLIPLDDEGRWYRYHHLFADLLRGLQSTLQEESWSDLHRRASLWYAQAEGEGGAFAGESIRHALAAEEYALAVEQLERHALEMIMQGYAKTVNGWVEAIPAAWRTQSPRTNLAFAWMHLLRGAYAQAVPYMERLEAALAKSGSGAVGPAIEAEWLVMRSLIANMEGQPVESRGMAERALEIAPEQESRARSLAYYALAGAYQLLEEDAQAIEAYRRAIQYGRAAESLVAELMSTAGLAGLAFERGRLHLAFEVAAPVSARLEESGTLPPISAVIDGLLGEIHGQWYDLERARYYVQRALRLSTLGGYGSGETYCRVLLSRLAELEGDLEAAALEIQKAVEVLRVNAPDDIRQEVVAQQVSVYLARDRPAAAEMVLQGQGFSFEEGFAFPPLPQEGNVPHARGLLYNSSLRLLLHRMSSRRDRVALGAGLELADLLIAGALRGPYLLVALETLLLRARLHALLGSAADLVAGREDLRRALALAEPEGIVGLFVAGGPPVATALADLLQKGDLDSVSPEYVARILDASGGAPSVPPVPRARPAPEQPVEPLTDRELEVLHLVAEGLKYKEIAAQLFISLNTVRYHIKAIYGKLQVSNRTQAVEAARRLRIL
jgi:LuxR family maltose regulon positive regulatory protein